MLEKKDRYNLAIAGATGAVGRKMLEILKECNFPVANLKVLASAKSAGQTLPFNESFLVVEELSENSFEGVDIALFSAGASVSQKFAPFAVKSGCIVIDNSSAFRMDPMTPLIVPEVNPGDIGENPSIISNPNCSTIQMVMALKPIHDKFNIKRVVVSTYQSVSGSGQVPFHHLIPDVLTLPWRPTPPTHPHPTVTYGEGYVTMTSTCQLCPSSCPVHVPTTAMSSSSQLCPSRPVHFSTTTSQASWQLTLPV